jgi:hypothetical protein
VKAPCRFAPPAARKPRRSDDHERDAIGVIVVVPCGASAPRNTAPVSSPSAIWSLPGLPGLDGPRSHGCHHLSLMRSPNPRHPTGTPSHSVSHWPHGDSHPGIGERHPSGAGVERSSPGWGPASIIPAALQG